MKDFKFRPARNIEELCSEIVEIKTILLDIQRRIIIIHAQPEDFEVIDAESTVRE